MHEPTLIFFALAAFFVHGLTNAVSASTKQGAGKKLAWAAKKAANRWIFPKAKVDTGPSSRAGGHGCLIGGGILSTLAVALLVGVNWGTLETKKNIDVLPFAEAQSAAPFVASLIQPSILQATPPKPMDRKKNMETAQVVGNKKAVVQYDQRDLPFLGHHAALLRDFQEQRLLRSMGQKKNNSCIGILGRKMEKKARQRYTNENQGTV